MGTSPTTPASRRISASGRSAAILRDAGMDYRHIVRINAFVTEREALKAYMEVRDRYVASPPPASTLMIVSGFARPVNSRSRSR